MMENPPPGGAPTEPPPPPVAPYPPNPPAPAGPIPTMTPPAERTGLSIASLVVGILSLCGSGAWWCGGILAMVAIVLGVLGLNTRGRGMAMAGIILGAVALLLTIILTIFFRGGIFINLFRNFMQNRGY